MRTAMTTVSASQKKERALTTCSEDMVKIGGACGWSSSGNFDDLATNAPELTSVGIMVGATVGLFELDRGAGALCRHSSRGRETNYGGGKIENGGVGFFSR